MWSLTWASSAIHVHYATQLFTIDTKLRIFSTTFGECIYSSMRDTHTEDNSSYLSEREVPLVRSVLAGSTLSPTCSGTKYPYSDLFWHKVPLVRPVLAQTLAEKSFFFCGLTRALSYIPGYRYSSVPWREKNVSPGASSRAVPKSASLKTYLQTRSSWKVCVQFVWSCSS